MFKARQLLIGEFRIPIKCKSEALSSTAVILKFKCASKGFLTIPWKTKMPKPSNFRNCWYPETGIYEQITLQSNRWLQNLALWGQAALSPVPRPRDSHQVAATGLQHLFRGHAGSTFPGSADPQCPDSFPSCPRVSLQCWPPMDSSPRLFLSMHLALTSILPPLPAPVPGR